MRVRYFLGYALTAMVIAFSSYAYAIDRPPGGGEVYLDSRYLDNGLYVMEPFEWVTVSAIRTDAPEFPSKHDGHGADFIVSNQPGQSWRAASIAPLLHIDPGRSLI